ncbi:WYL domain-containing protein [bacterium SCSIO 12741]|nr:WYL domain-containing protein [bacterium SCSIO 12741]
MPANKYALLRYRILDKRIRNKYKPYPTKEDLRQACEDHLYNSFGERVSESTIEKDLFAMRNEEGLGYLAPIKYSREYGGYYYTDPDYSIDDLPLNEEDMEALKFAATTLSQFKEIRMFDRFGSAIDKLMGRLSMAVESEQESVDQFVQFENTPTARGTEYLSSLLEAAHQQAAVRMKYQSFTHQQESSRIFHPYLLKEFRHRWYVVGFDADGEKIKTFGLDRITGIEPMGSKFEVREAFERDNFFKHTLGITTGTESPERVRLSFTPSQAHYLKTQPLHESQQILVDNDKEMQIELQVVVSHELIMQLLSFGKQVQVMEPSSLVQKIQKILQETLNQYSA